MPRKSTKRFSSLTPLLRSCGPVAEALERRSLLAVVTVSNTLDVVNGNTSSIAALIASNGGDGISLREAATAAGNTVNVIVPDEIRFNILGAGPHSIVMQSALSFSERVVIDGSTEPDFAGSPVVELNGFSGAYNGIVINFGAGGSTIRGLAINRYGQSGIVINGSNNNVIEGNYIGTNVTGTADFGNAQQGISVVGQVNRIGGTTAAARNIISGNNANGISIGAASINNVVQGNYIGTNAAGTGSIANSLDGISVGNATDSQIGGVAPGQQNLISGNAQSGVYVASGNGTLIEGNLIGTDVTGTSALGNGLHGVRMASSANRIGGTVPEARNIISGNVSAGVAIEGGAAAVSNAILGNYIGTDITGTARLWNQNGISVTAQGTRIGGIGAGSGNVITGQGTDILVLSPSTGTTIEGNLIGVDATGTVAMGGSVGIRVSIDAAVVRIGGPSAEARNIISGHTSTGISSLQDSEIRAEGNYIGTDITGTLALPNVVGVEMVDPSFSRLMGNVISGNIDVGIRVSTIPGEDYFAQIYGNAVGTQADRISPLGNGSHGIRADLAQSGGILIEQGNVIAYNGGAGIAVPPTAVNGLVRIADNSIFSNVLLGIDLGLDGVTPNDPGDADAGANGLLNFPTLTSVVTDGIRTILNGSLNSSANREFVLRFFQSGQPDSSGYGEGETLVHTRGDLFTNASGDLNFSIELPIALSAGSWISALATTTTSSATSEFSLAKQVISMPMLAIVDASLVEGNSGSSSLVFTVHRTGTTAAATTVQYSTLDDTALAPDDYLPFGVTHLTFAPGETTRTITVPVRGDTTFEPNETFFVNLFGATNAVVIDAQATGTIVNDDADSTPPMVLSANFIDIGTLPNPYEAIFDLSEVVTAPPGGVPLLIRRIDNGQLVATVFSSLEEGTRLRGRFTSPLADGNFRATIPSGSVADQAGNFLQTDVDLPFFVLQADANHDRYVNSPDFTALAMSFNMTTDVDFSTGDFNYDGRVNALDFNALASKFGAYLAPPSAAPSLEVPNAALAAVPSVGRLFSEDEVRAQSDELVI